MHQNVPDGISRGLQGPRVPHNPLLHHCLLERLQGYDDHLLHVLWRTDVAPGVVLRRPGGLRVVVLRGSELHLRNGAVGGDLIVVWKDSVAQGFGFIVHFVNLVLRTPISRSNGCTYQPAEFNIRSTSSKHFKNKFGGPALGGRGNLHFETIVISLDPFRYIRDI